MELDILEKLGVKLGHIIVGLIGGLFSVLFNKYPKTTAQKIRSVFVMLLGAVLTAFLTPAIIKLKPALESVEHSVAFMVGVFGIGIMEIVWNVIIKLKNDPINTLKSIKDVFKTR